MRPGGLLINQLAHLAVSLGLLGGVVEVRPCAHGRGVFASDYIAVGSVIREFGGVALTSRPASSPEGGYALRVGEHEYWDGFPDGSPDYWSNLIDHSDSPNSVFVFDKEGKRAWLKAAKPIEKGQELLINYRDYYPTNPVF
jgi:SET domain-containing protein